jgi:hypothetical protein
MKLTSAQDAIKQAIEGGYLSEDIKGRKVKISDHGHGDVFVIQAGNFEMTVPESALFLDPLFWQALGKARGWKDEKVKHGIVYVFGGKIAPLERWKVNALHYFETRLSSGDQKRFWESLL